MPFGLAVVAFAAGATSPAAAATDVAIVAVSASGRRKAESDIEMAPWPVVSAALHPARAHRRGRGHAAATRLGQTSECGP